jgi:RNA polymerase sigma-70 factor (ECF subfamily)
MTNLKPPFRHFVEGSRKKKSAESLEKRTKNGKCGRKERIYLSKEGERGRCLKRGGKLEFVRWDPENAETLYLLEPASCLMPETIFDARWATTLLDEVVSRLGREYAPQGKSATFLALKPFLDPKNAQILPSYEVLANQLHVTLGAVKTLIHRLRKQYAYLLREEVARTVCDRWK